MPPGDVTARAYTLCLAYMTSLLQMVMDISIISDLPPATLPRATTALTTVHGMWWFSTVSARRGRLYLEDAQPRRPKGNGFKRTWRATRPYAQWLFGIRRFTARQVLTQLQRYNPSGRFCTTRALTW